ncbi:hypothetical protein [Lusitaniella coriacea]|uniref:hypothetical protein n=1 Tax=Lusitaniella coriacea TaxID=1983105 RepID=UPI003CEAA3CA
MDEQLQQAIEEVQRCSLGSEERESALSALVKHILRSRKVFRFCQGQPLWGIYEEVYQRLKVRLTEELNSTIDDYNLENPSVREWASNRLNIVYRSAIDHALLKRLAIEAQNQEPGTELRQYALRELVGAIQVSGRLCHPHRGRWNPQFYELVYEETVNQTLIYVCQKIHLYNPNRGDGKFMNWVNFKLDKKFLDIAQQFRNSEDLPNLSEIENIPTPEYPPSIANCIQQVIERDPDNLFTKTHIRGNQKATFKAIVLARLLGKSWEEISQELGEIPVATLSGFFYRCCKKFSYLFEQCRY